MPKGYHADGSLMGCAAVTASGDNRYAHFLRPGESHPTYTPEDKRDVLALLAQGYTPGAIEQMEGKPTRRTILWWVQQEEAFRDAYYAARRLHAESRVDYASDAADAANDKDSASAARVKADTALKVAAMFDPARFSQKSSHAGAVNVTIATNLGGPAQIRQDGAYRVTIDASQHDEPGNPQETTTS